MWSSNRYIFFFLFFFLKGRRTFRDHVDEMRKLSSSLNLFKLFDLSNPQIPHFFVLYSRGYLPYIIISLVRGTMFDLKEFHLSVLRTLLLSHSLVTRGKCFSFNSFLRSLLSLFFLYPLFYSFTSLLWRTFYEGYRETARWRGEIQKGPECRSFCPHGPGVCHPPCM